MLTLALNPVVTNLLVVFFLLVCVGMILIVLIQRPQGGGLSGAFGAGGGGAGAGQTAFGTKTGDVLTWSTVAIFFIFLLTAIGLNFIARPDTSGATTQPTLVDPEQQPPPEDPAATPDVPGEEPVIETTPDPTDPDPDALPPPSDMPDTPGDDEEPPVDPASAEQPA